MRVLTPPYHWAIVASPLPCDDDAVAHQILYRGSIPAARNAAFVRRLGIKTLICMRKKPLKETDPFMNWAGKNGINVVWVKADKMGEETLGMDRDEVTKVLKVGARLCGQLTTDVARHDSVPDLPGRYRRQLSYDLGRCIPPQTAGLGARQYRGRSVPVSVTHVRQLTQQLRARPR